MDPEEQELQNDYRYRSYSAVIEKALRNFESSSEWADLISSLGKLIKALQSNLKYSLLPRRLIIGKRLAQCLHPALPSGVHLKALETYEVIFKIIGTKWLAKDLFIYSSGLFPLLGHAAMSVKPVLLVLYERYYLPLQHALLPSLQAFVTGLLPGLEEGLEVYDRTDALLLKLCTLVGPQVLYGALWGSMLVTPLVRLPASHFIVIHFDRMAPGQKQRHMLGTDHGLVMKSICLSLQDSNLLVQRNVLEILLFFFPFYTCLDPAEASIPLTHDEVISLVSAALMALLRRDMSLNRRLYAWLQGTDSKGSMVAVDPNLSATLEEHTTFYFEHYSRELLLEALTSILKLKNADVDPENVMVFLRPFRIIISLLDKPEIGPKLTEALMLEVVRALYTYVRDMLGEEDNTLESCLSKNQLASKVKENKNALEIIKTASMLMSSLNSEFLWDFMTRLFQASLSVEPSGQDRGAPPSVSEVSVLIMFLLEVVPLVGSRVLHAQELYSEIQTQYLPQMLYKILQVLQAHLAAFTLPELNQAMRTAFMVLSKIRMPVAYMDMDAKPKMKARKTMENRKHHADEEHSVDEGDIEEGEEPDLGALNEGVWLEAEPGDTSLPTVSSEDSGLGLSASTSEQHLSQQKVAPEACPAQDKVWRKGGSMEDMARCMQDILDSFINRYLLRSVGEEKKQREGSEATGTDPVSPKALAGQRSSREQLREKLTELFTPNMQKLQQLADSAFPSSRRRQRSGSEGGASLEWGASCLSRDRAEISESCRQAFGTTCHLLLECSTFPVYLLEDEIEVLYAATFQNTGNDKCSLPSWLRSLMTLCCVSKDSQIQHAAVSSLLELVSHSQSLAMVMKDKYQRYKGSESNPFSGRLQMVTVPPVSPALLKAMEEDTDFYQHVAQVLWAQLDSEQGELHVSCVELFYRLHCLAPSASVCEDIICLALQHREKAVQLEALRRFSVLWHLTRDVQTTMATSLNRSFDRSLFVVLGRLNSSDGSVSTTAQSWLVHALALGDITRILEPVLLLLLHPETQRCSIQCTWENLTTGTLRMVNHKGTSLPYTSGSSADVMAMESLSEERLLTWLMAVDRDSLWAELEHIPETMKVPDFSVDGDCENEDRMENEGWRQESGESSEHTDSADTSGAQLSTETSTSASGTAPYLQRMDSTHTQASESLSSEDEAEELAALAHQRLLKQQQEQREAVSVLFRHTLLYLQPYEQARILRAFSILEILVRICGRPFVEATSTTTLDSGVPAHLALVCSLLLRHQETLEGRSFYGRWPAQSAEPQPQGPLIELLASLCLRFLRSYYPRYLRVDVPRLQGNLQVQVKSTEVLTCLLGQLVDLARTQDQTGLDMIRRLLSASGVQQYVLLSLSASMHISQLHGSDEDAAGDPEGPSEECLIERDPDVAGEHALQVELLKLLRVLVVLEHLVGPEAAAEQHGATNAASPLAREWQTAQQYQQSIRAPQYVPDQPITAQGMFVSAVSRALLPRHGYTMHPHWVALVCASLPYLGRSLAVTATPFIVQICKNLDELVHQYEHEANRSAHRGSMKRKVVAPDYLLTLLEGLTTITHYCLLDYRKPLSTSDVADLRNARNAILEELPRIVSSMALLWGVIRREEGARKGSDSSHGPGQAYHSACFKNIRILRQKVLEFLEPLVGLFGMQIMASVGAVWNSRRSKKRHSQNKILPAVSEPHLTIVELVKSLSVLRVDTILQLVKEVVKKPHQIKGEQKSTLVDIPLLQFTYTYIQSISAQVLQENVTPLLCLLKESVQMNLAPPGHFLLLRILNDLVNRLPNLENKKDNRDVQEVTQRILDAVANVVGSSLEQTSWLSRNLEVKAQPQVLQEEEEEADGADLYDVAAQPSAVVSSSAPSVYSVQALSLLAEVLAPLLDMVYRSEEKERAVPLISRLLYFVFPYLRNHSAHNVPSFCAAAQLLSSLSGYAYTKRTWKKEVFELFMDPMFFHMDAACVTHWKSIVDHLLTHEKTMFKELMGLQSSSLKVLSGQEQKALLLKRQAFSLFSGELDQYHPYLPLIQERLTETLRVGQTPSAAAQIFLTFRVLLLRISPQHLTSLWPIMITELIHAFVRLQKNLLDNKVSKAVGRAGGGRGGPGKNGALFLQNELDMYLSAFKFLDTALSFPPDRMPLFQMYRWAFIPEVDIENFSGPDNGLMESEPESQPHVVRILEGLRYRFGELNGMASSDSTEERLEFPLLRSRSISCISELLPFLLVLSCSFRGSRELHMHGPKVQYPAPNSEAVLSRLEEVIEVEFLETL